MNKIKIPLLVIVALVSKPLYVQSQSSPVSLDLILSPAVENAQTLSPNSLGIDTKGKGQKVVDIIIRNESSERQSGLYFWIRLEASRFGTIIELTQRLDSPFSLAPNQIIVTDNNNIEKGLPGITESIRLDVTTDNSQAFINSLGGSTTLPDDVYTFTAQLRKGGNTPEFAVSTIRKTLGARPVVSTVDLFLLQPGGLVGSNEKINVTMPLFRWDGPTGKEYRLIVVRDIKQSPEALIQQAFSTPPTVRNGRSAADGNLLEFEILDVVVKSNSFNFPPSGTQKLQAGEKYFWQVFTEISAPSGVTSIPSAIWEFRVVDPKSGSEAEMIREIYEKLGPILKADRISELRDKGFMLDSITLDGQSIRGTQAILLELEKLAQKAAEKKITINQ
jgi:hypothetical protein